MEIEQPFGLKNFIVAVWFAFMDCMMDIFVQNIYYVKYTTCTA